MVLTSGQEQAVKVAVQRYKNHEPYTVIAGYAGTGKTTCVQYIIDALGMTDADVVYIAYTGKATLVLSSKGCNNTMTAHKFLYDAVRDNETGEYKYIPKPPSSDYKVVVLDECSMLPIDMWELLLTHHIYVIALGDHGQLPPIGSESSILDKPHVVLDEITRQALDSPIIRLSMDVRNDSNLEYGGCKTCRIIKPTSVSSNLLQGADQILCGTNKTRRALNYRVRKLKWQDDFSDTPKAGDKIICLRNHWNIISSAQSPLINGMIGELKNIFLDPDKGLFAPHKMIADFSSDTDGLFADIQMDYNLYATGEPTINGDNWKQYAMLQDFCEFDYANAITVHKAQGSEFDKVLIYNEWFGNKDMHRRWLYTAITRAAQQVVVVK